MYTKINMPRGLNSGSSSNLVEYLSKEEEGHFFNKNSIETPAEQVQKEIDGNVSKLTKNEDKFYMLSFSPSEYELKQMIGRDIKDISELTPEEIIKVKKDLEQFTHKGMDNYAKNFNRENIKGREDLVYFGRVETERTYKHYDKEVREGTAKAGEKRPGLQFHVHVIVSRKSADGKVKLSPNTRFRGATWQRDGQNVTRGFNYTNFTQDCHNDFKQEFNINYDKYYNYTREQSAKEDLKNYVEKKGMSTIKSQAIGAIAQGEFTTERKIYSNTMQAVNLVKTAANLSNPATATKEAVKKILEFAQKIQDDSQSMGM